MKCDLCTKEAQYFAIVEDKNTHHSSCHKFCDYHKFMLDKIKHNLSVELTEIDKKEYELYYSLGQLIEPEPITEVDIPVIKCKITTQIKKPLL